MFQTCRLRPVSLLDLLLVLKEAILVTETQQPLPICVGYVLAEAREIETFHVCMELLGVNEQ